MLARFFRWLLFAPCQTCTTLEAENKALREWIGNLKVGHVDENGKARIGAPAAITRHAPAAKEEPEDEPIVERVLRMNRERKAGIEVPLPGHEYRGPDAAIREMGGIFDDQGKPGEQDRLEQAIRKGRERDKERAKEKAARADAEATKVQVEVVSFQGSPSAPVDPGDTWDDFAGGEG